MMADDAVCCRWYTQGGGGGKGEENRFLLFLFLFGRPSLWPPTGLAACCLPPTATAGPPPPPFGVHTWASPLERTGQGFFCFLFFQLFLAIGPCVKFTCLSSLHCERYHMICSVIRSWRERVELRHLVSDFVNSWRKKWLGGAMRFSVRRCRPLDRP